MGGGGAGVTRDMSTEARASLGLRVEPPLSLSLDSFLPDLDAEQHLSLFNTACSEVLNTTAPL